MNFFEAIGLADMERVHSQIIAWIFSEDCTALSDQSKINILSELSNTKINTIDKVITEFYSIDILIETNEIVFAIENKIKSSQHSNQLKKYKETLKAKYADSKEFFFIFLTLIEEESEDSDWLNIAYTKLHEKISSVEFVETEKDYVFVREYLDSIKNLNKVLKSFKKDHRPFINVFTDGTKKKSDKSIKVREYSDYEKYVSRFQLETMFQKQLFRRIFKELQKLNPDIRAVVSETRGTALLHIILKDDILYNDKKFATGFQIQGETIKFSFEKKDYANSNKNEMTDEIKELMDVLKKSLKYKQVNSPRSKARYSISKKLPKKLYEYEFEELVKTIRNEYEIILYSNEIKEKLHFG